MTQSLRKRNHPLAVIDEQRRVLAESPSLRPFDARLADIGLAPLRSTGITTFQINVGKMCNQVCKHCHVDAGPDRKEIMTRDTMELCLAALDRTDAPVVDLTGGAPEMNPDFRWLVDRVVEMNRRVIDRSNLTILVAPGYEDMPEFLASRRVEISASLPYYLESQTDAQRGDHVFERSIRALKRLNELGYGQPGSGLILNLVFNPIGAFLPPKQAAIESEYRRELDRRHGIDFNSLFTITNMPISRFLDFLIERGTYDGYMQKLSAAFNSDAAQNVMCRTTLSIGWDGRLYDCDFNQMLEMPIGNGGPAHIRDFDPDALAAREIRVGNHCYGCTAGGGSSCTGAVA
ncbi:MAG: arsenosugar biosynthesis radical SAM protein ArsS [Phycisphaerales bacterium]|nr:arsenosugar biosynthesis radical SAM protein ArsS [Phycisphaerales bacterium]MCB9854904.1 arsenosugar biosynthesis radical SAM protein ArsS [Phycisphaerales bacterium]MCB9864407.1 arsenosugar biosynthesis radical SAM protein ArsS [Phycisphaerales bacterium]